MFGLLHNLYTWVRKKQEKRITLVLLGIDNAGKTTLLHTVRGELDKEVTPTFGFSSSTLDTDGRLSKYKVNVFDLGGGKNIRRIWKTYFSEVHGGAHTDPCCLIGSYLVL
jgi:ADP-ribosylation factor-like protein 13B